MKRTVAMLTVVMATFAVVGTASAQVDPAENQVAFWCEPDDAGTKFEPVDTPFIVPEPPEGKTWTLLVLKAGSGEGANETVTNPIVGQGYSHSSGLDNSHTILCWEDEEVTTASSTTTTSSTSTTSSTTTTTTEPSTTTTTTTTSSSTTTTNASTTTTAPALTSTTTTVTSSSVTSSTVPPTTTTLTTKQEELPMTGIPVAMLLMLGTGLAVLGSAVLIGARKR